MAPTPLFVDVASTDGEGWKAVFENQEVELIPGNPESTRQLSLQFQPDLVVLQDGLSHDDSIEICHSYHDEQLKPLLLALSGRIQPRHPITDGHSDRLPELAMRLGASQALGQKDLQELWLGSLLHDIGKIAIPDGILLKPGKLTSAETEILRRHPVLGEKICAPLKSLRPILPMIRHHHERIDGTGYPDGLCGGAIPLKVRILQIADVYDALTNERPYRQAVSSNAALELLRREALCGHFDASLVWQLSRICDSGQDRPLRGHSMLASYYA